MGYYLCSRCGYKLPKKDAVISAKPLSSFTLYFHILVKRSYIEETMDLSVGDRCIRLGNWGYPTSNRGRLQPYAGHPRVFSPVIHI